MSAIMIQGSHKMGVSAEKVWPILFDPKGLMELIPGCQDLKRDQTGEYKGTIRIGIAGVAGSYSTTVRILETQPPHSCNMTGEIYSNTGTIKGEAQFFVEGDENSCILSYSAKGIITGAISKISPRFIEGVIGTLIRFGLDACERKLLVSQAQIL
jgi:carbon monoxide dehydrogenase subunit G